MVPRQPLVRTTSKENNTKIVVETRNYTIGPRVGNFPNCYSCCVDGWQCFAKEAHVADVVSKLLQTFEENLVQLEALPYHPNITKYFFHRRKGSSLFWFFSGEMSSIDLAEFISRREKKDEIISPKMIVKCCLDIVLGLEFLSKRGIPHPYLLSEDIYVNGEPYEDSPVRLIVGNLEKFVLYQVSNTWRQRRQVLGSPLYAPEILRQPKIAEAEGTEKQSVWSFGMILYELMTMKKPYSEVDFFRIPALILEGVRPVVPIPPDTKLVCSLFDIDPPLNYTKASFIRAVHKQSLKLTCLLNLCQNWDSTDTSNQMYHLPSDSQKELLIVFDCFYQLELLELFQNCTAVDPEQRPGISEVAKRFQNLKNLHKNTLLLENLLK